MCEKKRVLYKCKHAVTEEMKYCNDHKNYGPLYLNKYHNCPNDVLIYEIKYKELCQRCEDKAAAEKRAKESDPHNPNPEVNYPKPPPPKPFEYYKKYVVPHVEAAAEEEERREKMYKNALKENDANTLVFDDRNEEKYETKPRGKAAYGLW